MPATAATAPRVQAQRPARTLTFDIDGFAVAFTSDDYAWLGYVNERVDAAPSAARDPFRVRRQQRLEGDSVGGVHLEGEGFSVRVDFDARRAVVSGVRGEAATDALLSALLRHFGEARPTG